MSHFSFKLDDNTYLFFDIFYKNGDIHLIMPIYNTVFPTESIQLFIDDNFESQLLTLTEQCVKDFYEPTCIYKYNVGMSVVSDTIKVKVVFNECSQNYILNPIVESETDTIALTTLFKDDYRLFPLFYHYYTKQGVAHFYMYYNGKITEEIAEILNLPNVSLIEWDFAYWNGDECKYKHHAQMGQLNDALYKYGKNRHKYMIFCDMDEYMFIHGTRLNTFVDMHPNVDIFGFQNIWANTLDGQIPRYPIFPTEILVSGHKLRYNLRSKNIYKTSCLKIVGIHSSRDFCSEYVIMLENLDMFHFYKWSGVEREEVCDILMTVSIP